MSSQLKFKELYNDERNFSFLRLRTSKHISLDYGKAQLLAKNERSYFVPFSFAEEESKAELYYFVDAYTPLLDYLALGISAEQQKDLISQIIRIWNVCGERGFYAKNIHTSVDYCYVDPKSKLIKFIYLPLSGLDIEDRALHDFLIKVAESIRSTNHAGEVFAAKLLDYLRTQMVFSLFKLQQFIDPQNSSLPQGVFEKRPVSGGLAPQNSADDFGLSRNIMNKQQGISQEMQRDFVWEQSGALQVNAVRYTLKRVQDGMSWPITPEKVEIGRAPLQGLIVSQSSKVGRTHATLELYQGSVLICDCSSKNGTKVNGEQLVPGKPRELKVGDCLILGDEEFMLVDA